MIRILIATLIGIALMQSAPATTDTETWIEGRVLSSTGDPIPKVTVCLHPRDGGSRRFANTDEDGNFQFQNVRDKPYVLTFRQKGYAVKALEIEPQDFDAIPPVVLSPGKTVTGRVVDPNGNPIANISVRGKHWYGITMTLTWVETTTDRDGRFVLDDMPDEPLGFLFIGEGYEKDRVPMEAGQGEYEIVLAPDTRTPSPIITLSVKTEPLPAAKEIDVPALIGKLMAAIISGALALFVGVRQKVAVLGLAAALLCVLLGYRGGLVFGLPAAIVTTIIMQYVSRIDIPATRSQLVLGMSGSLLMVSLLFMIPRGDAVSPLITSARVPLQLANLLLCGWMYYRYAAYKSRSGAWCVLGALGPLGIIPLGMLANRTPAPGQTLAAPSVSPSMSPTVSPSQSPPRDSTEDSMDDPPSMHTSGPLF